MRTFHILAFLSALTLTSAQPNDGLRGATLPAAAEGVLSRYRFQSATGRPDIVPDRFYVGFKTPPGASERALVKLHGGTVTAEIHEADAFEIEAVRGFLGRAGLAGIAADGSVRYVENVLMRYASGLADTQLVASIGNGLYGLVTTSSISAQLSSTGKGVKACLADTQLDITHPDIAPNFVSGHNTVGTCTDTSTSASCSTSWAYDGETHATHVAGTILGAFNTVGVYGVAYEASLYHVRVLGPSGGSSTDILEGLRWLKTQGCQTINLSLGGGLKSRTEDTFYKSLRNSGIIVVAASGNDARATLACPACYAVNIAVGAVTVANTLATFSNYGTYIDVVGPGVDVLSSVPTGTGFETSVAADPLRLLTAPEVLGLQFAGTTSGAGITATLFDCGTCEAVCSSNGKIALCQRGTNTFAAKVTNAQAGGAVAVIIYNNVAGGFAGTLGAEGNPSWIPAVSASDTDGAAIKALGNTATATVVNIASSWDYYSGTSMAAPHVTGVIALMWQKWGPGCATLPCTVTQKTTQANKIEAKLKASADNLGAKGYDTVFGYGIVNAAAATSGTLG